MPQGEIKFAPVGLSRWLAGLLLLATLVAARAQMPPPPDPEMAIKQFSVPDSFKVDLFAAEPELRNPVAFCFDEHGRVYVAETFRYKSSVLDIREHMNIYYDDLACRTALDRANMLKRVFGDRVNELGVQSEVIQLIEDRAGTGRADHSMVFADGFNSILDGVGAGVLSRKGSLYYTDIPNLWLLQGTNQYGRADTRKSLSFGYGVHFGYTGHDLHGLRVGPDGKLYFSIGDRALNVTTKEGRTLDYSEMGSVLRCNLDGSDLEVFAYGLRNPQELAFDDHGNLFTGDNNCDHGDAARLVYVVEGGDTGWRNAYQISETTEAGLWNSESLWHLQFPRQAAYILPPIAHLGDGPAGFTHYPGTGFTDAYRDHFFLCDFRGTSGNSGVHSFFVKPKGAGFEIQDTNHFFWHVLATDADFSPDGQLFVTDWVRTFSLSGLGRIYRVSNPGQMKSALVQETKKLIADGMENRPVEELEKLLSHADQRVRQEAQFELADRAQFVAASPEARQKSVDALVRAAFKSTNALARLHGIWGMGQIGRASNEVMRVLLPLFADKDSEVRAQTAKVLGEGKFADAFAGLTNALADSDLHVRLFAAISLGKLGNKEAVSPLLQVLRVNADADVFLRHAGMMGLLGTADKDTLIAAAGDASRSVRMAVLLVMRRRQMPEIAMFLHDADQPIQLEAARAINDLPIREALPQLAALIEHPTGVDLIDRRIINATFRVGGEKNAAALVTYAADSHNQDELRSEALRYLGLWARPFPRDRVTGQWRPLATRDPVVARDALAPAIDRLIKFTPEKTRTTAMLSAVELQMTNAGKAVFATACDTSVPPQVRVDAIQTLANFADPRLAEAAKVAASDADAVVRKQGNRILAELSPANAVAILAPILEKGSIEEKQDALGTLAKLPGDAVDQLLADWVDKFTDGKVQKEIQYDLLVAASARQSEMVRDHLRRWQAAQPRNDEFAGYRELMYGGDAKAGRTVFTDRVILGCERCHTIQGKGGEVGPDLTGIGTRHNREYILESILLPNKQIAPGYDNVVVEMNAGQTYAGIVKSQDDKVLKIYAVEERELMQLKKSDIKSVSRGLSAMPEGMENYMSKTDLRNLVEFLATVK